MKRLRSNRLVHEIPAPHWPAASRGHLWPSGTGPPSQDALRLLASWAATPTASSTLRRMTPRSRPSRYELQAAHSGGFVRSPDLPVTEGGEVGCDSQWQARSRRLAVAWEGAESWPSLQRDGRCATKAAAPVAASDAPRQPCGAADGGAGGGFGPRFPGPRHATVLVKTAACWPGAPTECRFPVEDYCYCMGNRAIMTAA